MGKGCCYAFLQVDWELGIHHAMCNSIGLLPSSIPRSMFIG